MRRGCRRFALGILALTFMAGVHQAAQAQQPTTSPSPDEVAVTLRSYLAQNVTLPSGWSPQPPSVATPSELAYRVGDAAAAGQTLDTLMTAGFVEAFSQNIYPSLQLHQQQGQSRVVYQVWAYQTPAQAQAALTEPSEGPALTGSPVPNAPSYGDGGTTVTLTTLAVATSALPAGLIAPTDEYHVRWSRGPLLFDLSDYVVGGSLGGDTLAGFASAFDSHAATLGSPTIGAPQTPPPASEADRMAAMERMGTVVLDPSAIPAGYTTPGQLLDSVAGEVMTAPGDPLVTLETEDTQWQRIAGMEYDYRPQNPQSETLAVEITEDLTAAAADLDLHSPATNTPPTATTQMLAAPVQMGDATVLWDTVFAATSSGTDEEMDLTWRYGNVELTVSVYGLQGTLSQTALTNLAGWWDAAYQQSVYVIAPSTS